MRIQGRRLGTGIAQARQGQSVSYEMVIPDNTVTNLAWLAAEAKRWQAQADEFARLGLSPDLVRRSLFGTEVLAAAAENIRLKVGSVVVAQSEKGQLIAIGTYVNSPPEGYLNLQATEPRHLAGSPGTGQLRGVGTALVAAISRDMLRNGITAIYIHPLDDAAASFWRNRGFVICGHASLMCIRGRPGIEALINGCIARPEDPTRGDLICLGQPQAVRAYSRPRAYYH